MASIIPYSATALDSLGQQVRAVLLRGGLVAIPTETFYGLGVNPFDRIALDRLSAVKGRAEGKPILVLVGSPKDLASFAERVPSAASVLDGDVLAGRLDHSVSCPSLGPSRAHRWNRPGGCQTQLLSAVA